MIEIAIIAGVIAVCIVVPLALSWAALACFFAVLTYASAGKLAPLTEETRGLRVEKT